MESPNFIEKVSAFVVSILDALMLDALMLDALMIDTLILNYGDFAWCVSYVLCEFSV